MPENTPARSRTSSAPGKPGNVLVMLGSVEGILKPKTEPFRTRAAIGLKPLRTDALPRGLLPSGHEVDGELFPEPLVTNFIEADLACGSKALCAETIWFPHSRCTALARKWNQ